MRKTLWITASILGAILVYGRSQSPDLPEDWVEQALSSNPVTAQEAQSHLREAGPQGVALLERAGRIAMPADRQKRLRAALDHVGAQYNNDRTHLYWYTDLEKAKTAARASGKPLLSLRLLGRLDENLSCANSRFFRMTLYPDAAVNRLMKERFVLHWESVRPVPKVTLDFGDGRKTQRTVTGNSIHYVLDPDGNIVDALPGLYAADTFAKELAQDADNFEGDRQHYLQSTQDRLRKMAAGRSAQIRLASFDPEQAFPSAEAAASLAIT